MISVGGFVSQYLYDDFQVMGYASRLIKFTNYSLPMFQLELLAVVYLSDYLSDYIIGREVVVYSDN